MINSVRNTVLSVLNKNNFGYISPSDFNLYSKQAQIEIFEEYFDDINKVINDENTRKSGTEYANSRKAIEETLESFLRTDLLVQVSTGSNKYYIPSLTTTGYQAYMINKILCYKSVGTSRVFLEEAEKVSNSKITMLANSNLTAPTEKYPIYAQEGTTITVFPSTISASNSIDASYFRYPKDPKWTYTTLFNGEPTFNQSQPDYQDFEIPNEDEYKLVTKILQYAGLSIRDIPVLQFGGIEEQKQSQ
jgi:hypothetical protein